MQVWNVLHAARCKYRTQKNRQKFAICTPSHNCRAVSSQLRHVSTIRKKSCETAISPHMSSQYGELLPASSWDSFVSLGHPCKWKPTKLCTMFGRLLGWYTIHIFGGSCPVTEFCQVQNSLCVQALRSPALAALRHGTRVVVISQTLQHWADSATYIWQGAITLGTDPHSNNF